MRIDSQAQNRGSAMILVTVLITAVTLVILILLRATELRVRSVIRENQSIQAMYLAEAGIEKALWMLSGHEGRDGRWRTSGETVELFDSLTAFVSVSDWGGYVRIRSEAYVHGTGKRLEALAGQIPTADFRRAINTGNAAHALVVTGRNRIRGDVRVGMRGVEQGTVSGRGFEGKTPVDGRIERVEKPVIPVYDAGQASAFMTRCEALIASPEDGRIEKPGTVLDAAFFGEAKDRHIHFEGDVTVRNNGAACLLDSGLIVTCIGNMVLSGNGNVGRNVLFAAGGRIRIEESPSFKGCLFFSRGSMTISGRGEMDGQFFSRSGIELNGPSHLEFPSLLFSDGSYSVSGEPSGILLQSGAELEGTAILHISKKDGRAGRNVPLIRIDPSSSVTGVVYSEGQTTLEGRVYGCVAAAEFYFKESETVYINWMKDALVDRSRLPAGYTMPLLFESGSVFRTIRYESAQTLRKNADSAITADPYEDAGG